MHEMRPSTIVVVVFILHHCDFACLLYSKLVNRLLESRILEIIRSTVKFELDFIVDALPVELFGMNSTMMCNYIKFCADRLLFAFGCRHHYKVGNPFKWMEMISLQGKTNCWRILEIRHWSQPRGQNFCS